ncbi:response regulator [Motiliproteus sediminis]|uniref:response regulator n=1 Tax=Motiliproteus sediminis TaxID=1468178 RepID=UPI001AEFE0E2|nr:response regulator [Motiliproteus sediminis]
MSLPVLICDDSGFARKQLARSLPTDWDVDISFAANGIEAVAAIEAGKADILFLDLNMPVMDGYQVLEIVRARDLPTMVIVVSGDVQEQARARVQELGALDFIIKPVNPAVVEEILAQYGVLEELRGSTRQVVDLEFDLNEGYQEVANVAMGQAAALLAKVLGVFVDLPIPRVDRIRKRDLPARVGTIAKSQPCSVVSQGFVGCSVSGEALLLCSDAQFADMAQMMAVEAELSPALEVDLLMDVSNVLIGACLAGFREQLDLSFSVGHPAVLARGSNLTDQPLLQTDSEVELLVIEIHYGIKEYGMNFHLLLMFTAESLVSLEERIGFLVEQ